MTPTEINFEIDHISMHSKLNIFILFYLGYSLPRAKARLDKARYELHQPEASRTARRQELQKRLQSLSIYASQIGDTRPISFCQFSPDSKMLVTSSWQVF